MPLNASYEVWDLNVTNTSDKVRKLTITGYAEFTNNSNYEQDQVNLQYSQFITRTQFEKNRIRQLIHGNLDGQEEGVEVDHKVVIERFFGAQERVAVSPRPATTRSCVTITGIRRFVSISTGLRLQRLHRRRVCACCFIRPTAALPW